MTQIDLEKLEQALSKDELYGGGKEFWDNLQNRELYRAAARAYLASQATPTDDLMLCRRVVKGDTTKYYDYIPVQDANPTISQGEGQAETVGRTGGANPPTGAKVEVQAPEAGTIPNMICKYLEERIKDLEGYKNNVKTDISQHYYATCAAVHIVILEDVKKIINEAALQRASGDDGNKVVTDCRSTKSGDDLLQNSTTNKESN